MATVSRVLRHGNNQEYVLAEPAKLGDIFAYEDNFFPDRRAVEAYLTAHKQDFNDGNDRYFAFWEGGKKQFGSVSLPGYDPSRALSFGAYPFKAEDWITSTNGRIVVLPSAPTLPSTSSSTGGGGCFSLISILSLLAVMLVMAIITLR